MIEPEDLEWRMYGIVPYNISDIQKGIQFGHAVQEYNNLMFETISNIEEEGDIEVEFIIDGFNKWREEDKTFMVMNGGTTNDDVNDKFYGTINLRLEELRKIDIPIGLFREPDLGNQITGIVFLADERCFKKRPYHFDNEGALSYPDFKDFLINKIGVDSINNIMSNNINSTIESVFNEEYNQWVEIIGGEKNVALRDLISKLRFA